MANNKIEGFDDKFNSSWKKIAAERGLDSCIWGPDYAGNDYETKKKFIYELCVTNNDQAPVGKTIMSIKEKEFINTYIWYWVWCRDNGLILMIEKCRRMLISWVSRMLEIHELGIGLMQMIICDENMDQAQAHLYNMWWVYDQICVLHPELNLLDARTQGSLSARRCESLTLPNGSMAFHSNKQPEKLRGRSSRIVTLEEGTKYDTLDSMITQASAIAQGSATGGSSSFICVIGNLSRNPIWHEIKKTRKGLIGLPTRHPDWPPDTKYFTATYLVEGGGILLELDLGADEDKTPEWQAEQKKKFPNKEEYELEYERKLPKIHGKPVYSTFNFDIHIAHEYENKRYIPCQKVGYRYVIGLDAGNSTVNPAAALCEIHPQGQVVAFAECIYDKGGEGLDSFIPRLKQLIWEYLPERGDDIEIYADQSIGSRSSITGKTITNHLYWTHNLVVIPISNSIASRRASIDWALNDIIYIDGGSEDIPMNRFVVCPYGCPMLTEAFKGGYRFQYSTKENDPDPKPLKNEYSHIIDGLTSAMVPIRQSFIEKVATFTRPINNINTNHMKNRFS